jgi:hypothetical protein
VAEIWLKIPHTLNTNWKSHQNLNPPHLCNTLHSFIKNNSWRTFCQNRRTICTLEVPPNGSVTRSGLSRPPPLQCFHFQTSTAYLENYVLNSGKECPSLVPKTAIFRIEGQNCIHLSLKVSTYSQDGTRPSPWMSQLHQPQMMIRGATGGMRIDRGGWNVQRKPATVPLWPPQIQHEIGSAPSL